MNLEGQIVEHNERREADLTDQKLRVSTAFEELAERFPRRRFFNR